jgi:hypothetical protein
MKAIVAAATVLLSVLPVTDLRAAALFPKPLHLTRRIDDPISRKSATVEEYYLGSRVVAVGNDEVVIIDYEKQEITEIDRARATYSITRFDQVAKARASFAPKHSTATATAVKPVVTSLGSRASAAGRSLDTYEIRDEATHDTIQIGVDRGVPVSRAALDVLLGAAYPGSPLRSHDAIVSAAAAPASRTRAQSTSTSGGDVSYGLPADQSMTYEFEGQKITLQSSVTRIGDEAVPPDLLLIPSGAQRTESHLSALPRLVNELDRKPAARE